jgi:hypothetical protein
MTYEIREKVLRIMELALLLNPTETKQDTTDDKPTVFVWISGHIAEIMVDIHSFGWKVGQYPDVKYRFCYGDSNSISQIDSCISVLESIYAEWKNKAVPNE